MSWSQEGTPSQSCVHFRFHSPLLRWRLRRSTWRWSWKSTATSPATWRGESRDSPDGESARGRMFQAREAHSGQGIGPSRCSPSCRCCSAAASASHHRQRWPPSWVKLFNDHNNATSLLLDGGVTTGGALGFQRRQMPPSWNELERQK